MKTNFAAIIAMFTFEKIIIQDEKTKIKICDDKKKQWKEIKKINKEKKRKK